MITWPCGLTHMTPWGSHHLSQAPIIWRCCLPAQVYDAHQRRPAAHGQQDRSTAVLCPVTTLWHLLTNPGPVPSHSSHPHAHSHGHTTISPHPYIHPHLDTPNPLLLLSKYNSSCILQFTDSCIPIKYNFLMYLVMSWLQPCAYILCNPPPTSSPFQFLYCWPHIPVLTDITLIHILV